MRTPHATDATLASAQGRRAMALLDASWRRLGAQAGTAGLEALLEAVAVEHEGWRPVGLDGPPRVVLTGFGLVVSVDVVMECHTGQERQEQPRAAVWSALARGESGWSDITDREPWPLDQAGRHWAAAARLTLEGSDEATRRAVARGLVAAERIEHHSSVEHRVGVLAATEVLAVDELHRTLAALGRQWTGSAAELLVCAAAVVARTGAA